MQKHDLKDVASARHLSISESVQIKEPLEVGGPAVPYFDLEQTGVKTEFCRSELELLPYRSLTV